MSWLIVGVAGATLVGGYLASEASKDAADTGAKSADAARAQIAKSGGLARDDVLSLFGPSRQDLLAGSKGAFDMFSKGINQQQMALNQGNMNAQNTVGQGFGNVRNALLGMPVDQSQYQPQGVQLMQSTANPFTQAGGVETIGTSQLPAQTPMGVAGSAAAARGGGGGGGAQGMLVDALSGGATNILRGATGGGGIKSFLSGGLF